MHGDARLRLVEYQRSVDLVERDGQHGPGDVEQSVPRQAPAIPLRKASPAALSQDHGAPEPQQIPQAGTGLARHNAKPEGSP